jgi:hypothetical protein
MLRRGSDTFVAYQLRTGFISDLATSLDLLGKALQDTNARLETEKDQHTYKTLDKLRMRMRDCYSTLEYCVNTMKKIGD